MPTALANHLAALYGVGRNDRAFLSGNPDYPATDWWCWFENPAWYFPDNNYADIGPQSSRIMGYSRIGAYLAIHKEDRQDSTIYLRSASSLAGNTADTSEQIAAEQVAFPTVQGLRALARWRPGRLPSCWTSRFSRPHRGLCADLLHHHGGAHGAEPQLFHRRGAHQGAGPGKRSGGAVERLLPAGGGRALLCADGKQNKAYQPQSGGSYVYECYYWENVPAVCFLERTGELFFGTADGRLCGFNTDRKRWTATTTTAAAITACWTTKADDDGDFMLRKTMLKKGPGVMVKPSTPGRACRSPCAPTPTLAFRRGTPPSTYSTGRTLTLRGSPSTATTPRRWCRFILRCGSTSPSR